MKKEKASMWLYIGVAVMLVGIAALTFQKIFYIRQEEKTGKTQEVFYNPFMGFVVNADYPEAVGKNTLVYVDITWREWEPKEGSYATEQIWEENNLSHWKQEGKHVVLRFICDCPSEEEHLDIPDWLYEKTGDGVFYTTDYGKGYSPEYTNSYFIEKHREAILALGEAFKEESLLAYVEMGSLGHWGEWHTKYDEGVTRMPSGEIRRLYVEAYEEAFPYAKILARRPFEETAEKNMGLYNDMTGDEEATEEWLSWITEGGIYSQPVLEEELKSQPDIWVSSPIGGEFTSSRTFEEMLGTNLDTTLSLLQESHTTFLGPKCPVMEEVDTFSDGVAAVLMNMGYRYRVSEASLSYWKWQQEGKLTLTINNDGVAPIYFPWKMYLYIYDEQEMVQREEIPVELTKLCGGEVVTVTLNQIPVGESYRYGVCIEDPETGKSAVYLDMDSEVKDLVYDIFPTKP